MKTTPIRAARSHPNASCFAPGALFIKLLRARIPGFTAAAIFVLMLLGGPLCAATEYARGNITWDNGITANQWATSSDGTLNQVWTSGNNAVFEVSAGTVTVAAAGATVDNINFNINGFTLAGGPLTFSGTTPTITLNSSNVTVDTVFAGTSGITISGTGAIGFFANSTYTGGTTIVSGTLKAGNTTALGASSSAVTVESGGTLSVYGVTMTATNPATLNGTGVSGAGAMTNTYANPGTYAGLVTLGSSSSIVTSSGALTLANTGTITGAGFNLTLSGTTNGCVIASGIGTGSGALIKQGAGSWSLSGANAYTGGTTISTGALSFANTSAIPATGTVAVAANATLGLGISGANAFVSSDLDHAYAGVFSGNLANVTMAPGACVGVDTTQGSFTYISSVPASSYGLTKLGPNTLTLTGANSFTGTTNVIAGTLEFAGAAALYNGTTADWTAAQIFVHSGGTLAFQVDAAGSNGFTSSSIDTLQANLKTSINQNGFMAGSAIGLDTTDATGGVFTYNTTIGDSTGTGSGSVGLTKLGNGTLIVGGANTYSGATTLVGGTLQLASTTALPVASTLVFNGAGVVNLNGNTQTVANLTFPGLATGTASMANGSLTVTGASGLNLSPLAIGSGAVTVDLSGLTFFVYNQPSMPFTFYGASEANSALNLAETNTITASVIDIANGGFSAEAGGMTATVTLGQTNVFNTSTFQIGGYHNAAGTVTLNTALTSPTLRLRGTGGGITPVASVIVGDNSNGTSPGNFTLDTTAGSIDAIVTNFYAVETLNGNYTGNMNMAAGTVNCGTLYLNYAASPASATTSAYFNQNAGTVLAGAVDFNNGNDTAAPTLTSTYNLGPASGTLTSGLLSAQTITVGSPTMVPNTASQAALNFSNGTIQNYDPALGQAGSAGAAGTGSFTTPQSLTISGATGGGAAGDYRTLNIVLAATGTQNLYAESGYSISVQSTALISGSGGLNCNGPGVVSLAGAHTYTGPTNISTGTLALTGGGSIAGTPAINLLNGAAFDVTGNSAGFTLASSQTLSNTSASTGKLAGNLNAAACALTITYTNGVPAFSIANGTLTLGSGSIFTINNAGAPLGAGNYLMISSLSGGSVTGTLPVSAIVNGSNGVGQGLVANMTASWSISGGALYLVVAPSTATVATTVALSAGSNPSVAGQSLTLTATIKVGGSTATAATGTVTFFDGTTALSGPIALSNGVATFTSSALAAGTQSITAVYNGNGTYAANPSSALAETIYPFTLTPESITFSTSNPAAKVLNTSFCGLSYEKSEITGSLFAPTNTSLIAMFGQIAPAVLRIGGNSVDTTCWGGLSGLTPITSAQVDSFAGFVNALPAGWRVIYGINMSVNTPANCAAEAAYVAHALGSRLLGFEIGNECDLYHSNGIRATTYTYSQFDSQWQALASAVTSTVPGYVVGNSSTGWTLTGPADADVAGDYAIPFASSETGVISLLTTHYYRANGESPTSTVAFLLTPDTSLPAEISNCVAAAASNNLPLGYRCSECGSYYNGGAPNVSDAYGTALWTLDFMFTEALNGSQGINFHGGGDGTGYTPIADNDVTVVQARPEFYGLKMFSLVSQGTVTPATITPSPTINFTAYVVQRASGGSSTVLVNKETATSVQATINLGTGVTSYQTLVLTGPNLSATSGYTLGGAPINPNGSWAGGFQTAVAAPGGQVTVTVPPMTAFLINPLTNVTIFNWLGGSSSTWTASANWDSNGVMPTNATTANRLNVLNGPGNDCYYNFSGISTTNNNNGATNGFVIGNSTTTGRLHITAGTFNSGGGDIIGAGYGSNTLIVDGGTYLSPSLTLGSVGNSTNNFQITAGSAVITSLTTAAGTNVVSLSGGTLSATSIGLTGGVANSLQFNGGTLQAAASNPAFIAPALDFTVLVSAGGAVINDGGYGIGITTPLLADPNSAGGGLTKTGAGKLTLGAANTYAGNTTVSAGTLALTGSGALAASPVINVQNGATFDVTGLANSFTLAGGQTLSNTSTASGLLTGNITAASGGLSVSYASGTPAFSVTQGSLTLGASTRFSIANLGAALAPGSYTIVAAGDGGSVNGTAPSSVTVTGAGLAYGLAASLGISNGNLVLTVSPNSGYSSWLYSYYPSLADKTPTDAPAGDNIATLMKYVLNANPSTEGFSSLPGVTANGASVIFTYTQLAASASVTAQVFEYSVDLANWTSINVTPPTGAQVQLGSSVSTPTGPVRTITITVPKGSNTQIFGRLSVTLPP